MSLAGTWKKVKVDNGMAFGKAIGATEAQLASSANAVSTVTYTVTGNNVKVERCHKYDGKELVSRFLIANTVLTQINPDFRKPSTKLLSDPKVNSTQWATKSKPN